MKKINIIGIGTGLNTLTKEAEKAINDSQVIIGAKTLIPLFGDLFINSGKLVFESFLPSEICGLIARESYENFSVLVSGDVGFYSVSLSLSETLKEYDLSFLPGISTVNMFFAKLGLPWQEAYFISLHGRSQDIVSPVRRNKYTFCLTGNNVNYIGAALENAGLGNIKAFVGENLGSALEKVYTATVTELKRNKFPSLTVLLFENEDFNQQLSFGLPDNSFVRMDKIPMTKSEIRALCLSKLNLKPNDICYDIGAGTGSVTVEMALNTYLGHVYAIERKEEAIPLIKQNLKNFHIGNVTLVCGYAPEALTDLPKPNIVFIGGSGGNIEDIIGVIFEKNPKARIVLTAVTAETENSALNIFKTLGVVFEMMRVNISRREPLGEAFIFKAQNPVTIISAGGFYE